MAVYGYHFPKLNIPSDFGFYPSLTAPGRVRFAFEVSNRYEMSTDIFINPFYGYHFDNYAEARGLP